MKKAIVSLLIILTGIFALNLVPVGQAFAGSCGGVDTAVINCNEGAEDGVMYILSLVRDIMTVGVGILGVIGITIVGIQYLTAGGSEEKTRKAKRRMFEIVIGLVFYVFIYFLIDWLTPTLSS